jgi:hypothetical protein
LKILGRGGGGLRGALGVVRKSGKGGPLSSFIAYLFDNFLDLTPFPCVHL